MSVRTLPTPLALDDFELGVTLGTGSFGRVRFCTHKVRSSLPPNVSFPRCISFVSLKLLFFRMHPYSQEHWVFLGYENAQEV